MKKILTVILSWMLTFIMGMSFSACKTKELQMNTEYVYSGISFKKADDLKIEDLGDFIPASIGADAIDSIEAFEVFLRNNIETYSIVQKTENGRKTIYLKPSILSVKIVRRWDLGASLVIKKDTDEFTYSCVIKGNHIFSSISEELYFEENALHYDLRFNDKFAVVYNYVITS